MENIVDGFTDKGTQRQEFAVNTMQSCFQKIALAWVLAVKKLEKIDDEVVVNVLFCNSLGTVGSLQKSKKYLENGIILPDRKVSNYSKNWLNIVNGVKKNYRRHSCDHFILIQQGRKQFRWYIASCHLVSIFLYLHRTF